MSFPIGVTIASTSANSRQSPHRSRPTPFLGDVKSLIRTHVLSFASGHQVREEVYFECSCRRHFLHLQSKCQHHRSRRSYRVVGKIQLRKRIVLAQRGGQELAVTEKTNTHVPGRENRCCFFARVLAECIAVRVSGVVAYIKTSECSTFTTGNRAGVALDLFCSRGGLQLLQSKLYLRFGYPELIFRIPDRYTSEVCISTFQMDIPE